MAAMDKRFVYSSERRPIESAKTNIATLPDGRMELKINHQPLVGVTSEMLVWWFQNFPDSPDAIENDLDSRRTAIVNGVRVPFYWIWHPEDHFMVQVVKPAPGGAPGLSQGARASIKERLDKTATHQVHVEGMDEDGIHLAGTKGPFRLLDLRHAFTDTSRGLVYKTRLLVGSPALLVGPLLSALARNAVMSPDTLQQLLSHNIQEVGNFETFLPKLFEQRDEQTPVLHL